MFLFVLKLGILLAGPGYLCKTLDAGLAFVGKGFCELPDLVGEGALLIGLTCRAVIQINESACGVLSYPPLIEELPGRNEITAGVEFRNLRQDLAVLRMGFKQSMNPSGRHL